MKRKCLACLTWQDASEFVRGSTTKCNACRRRERVDFHRNVDFTPPAKQYRTAPGQGRWPHAGSYPPPFPAKSKAYKEWYSYQQHLCRMDGTMTWHDWFARAKQQAYEAARSYQPPTIDPVGK